MEFELTDEQLKYILDNFCDCEDVVLQIVDFLNYFNVIKNEEDFVEVVSSVACRYESAKIYILSHLDDIKYSRGKTKPVFKDGCSEPINIGTLVREYMPIEEMIISEVKIKYQDDYESNEGLEDNYDDDDQSYLQPKKLGIHKIRHIY